MVACGCQQQRHDTNRCAAAAAVVGLFESTIAQFTALAAVLPVVAGQSGNAGAQALAMVISMFAAGLAGALVPMVLRRIGQDPATASSIILTTLTDVVGFFSFLGIAALFAPMLAATVR